MRENTVCFSGHRPEKLPGYDNKNKVVLQMIKSTLYFQIYQAIADGYRNFISGLARGTDLWAAEYVLDLKRQYPDIRLIGAIPFPEHSSSFRGGDLWSFNNVAGQADEIVCTSQEYSRDCYKIRNQYMVDRSSRLIAVVSDYKSGTGQTINYAKKQNLDLHIINVNEFMDAASGTGSFDEIFLD